MKTKQILLLAVLFAIALGTRAQITLLDPVVTDSYMAFVGENQTNNYRFTLDTYEWEEDHGPQFQLTIEPLDATKPSQFTSSDLSDPNYWEPMFRNITKEMAGNEMTAQDNVKRLYVKNVALLDAQFGDYENLHIISIEAAGDYTIPNGSFNGCKKLETLDCNVQGTLTLGSNIVNNQPAFTVKVYTKQSVQAWNEYKANSGANFTVDDSEVVDTNAPKINAVNLNLTVNDENRIFDLADQSGKQEEGESIVKYVLNSFKAMTSGDVKELFMDYSVFPASESGQQHEWKQLYASDEGNGAWSYSGPAINLTQGLQSNTEYRLEFSFNTDYIDQYGRSHYPTDGQTVRIAFNTGDLSTGIHNVHTTAATSSLRYNLNGQRVADSYKGIIVTDGKKIIVNTKPSAHIL